jgi:hypothetical protein
MKNAGKDFEKQWQDSCKLYQRYFIRLVDSNKFGFGEETRFTPENKCDAIQYSPPIMIMLELKSSKGTGIGFNPKRPWEKIAGKTPSIKPNQVSSLAEASCHNGIIAGLIFNFRERETKTKKFDNETFFVEINDFLEFAEKNDKSSISREDTEKIGIKVEQKKKISKYTYEIQRFEKDVIQKCVESKRVDLGKIKETIEELMGCTNE